MTKYIPPKLTANEEPLLHELLNDPIAHLLMQKDGVERAKLDPMLKKISHQVEAREVA